MYVNYFYINNTEWFGLWCLTPLSKIFQLYRGGQFYLVEETGENYSTDLSQVTDKLYHINVVLCTQYRMKSSYNLEKFIFVNFIYLKKDYKRKRDHFDQFNRNFNCDNV
jgi:hypothetical protein